MRARLIDWQARASAYIERVAAQPFRYGSLDCGLFVAGAIEALTGVDVAAPLRGQYTNRAEAFAAIAALCGSPTMEAVGGHLARVHGIPEVGILSAQRGDPVQIRRGRRSSLGIVAMHGTEILTPYRAGLLRLPLNCASRAWHI